MPSRAVAPFTPAVVAALPPDVDAVALRAGRRSVVAAAPGAVEAVCGAAAFDRVDRLAPGWWAGFFTYDLGRSVEAVRSRHRPGASIPDALLARFDARIAIDESERRARVVGDGAGRPLLEWALERARRGVTSSAPPAVDGWRSSLTRREFVEAVGVVLEHVAAGDCYQVNLTRRLTSEAPVDPVALYAALHEHNPAPYAAFLRFGGADGREPVAVVSASPELFLAWRGAQTETRPVKGTAPDRRRLRTSAKDRAENVMIVDLARNDLGRVCKPSSIDVPSLCALEDHPGLVHLVSTVRGLRREDAHAGALLRATFPPASVTGAPKPRVMQIIEDLEPVRRGVYCGAIGWIDTERDEGEFNVAIRTFTITSDCAHLGIGAGIVADSQPEAEWEETELKASRLLAAAAIGTRPVAATTPSAGARR